MANYKNKQDILTDLEKRVTDNILEKSNYDLLEKLINNAENFDEALKISALGTTYKRTGFHFDKRLERTTNEIAYFKKNEKLSFVTDEKALTHKLVIGDNYPALLNLLVEYRGIVDVIYIDPPYGKDSMGEFAETNYDNAITRDNLLSMLYPRLWVAKQLMSENGIIICSIDDRNQAYVKCLLDEIFEECNFIGTIIQNKCNAQNDAHNIQKNHDYHIVYAKSKTIINGKEQSILSQKTIKAENLLTDEHGSYYLGAGITTGGVGGTLNKRPNLGYTIYFNPQTTDKIAVCDYDKEKAKISNIENEIYKDNAELKAKGYVAIRPPQKAGLLGCWTWALEKFNRQKNEIAIQKTRSGYSVIKKIYTEESERSIENSSKSIVNFSSAQGTTILTEILGKKFNNNPKNIDMIKYFIELYNNKNATVLDFFAGSGTTGQAVLELNAEDNGERQFILVTNNDITDTTSKGIATDVTSKRLKRVMTGKCYDGTSDFDWAKENKPLGDNLLVLDIDSVANFENTKGKTPFDVIDETLYGSEKLSVKDKVEWVCNNFEITQKKLEDK